MNSRAPLALALASLSALGCDDAASTAPPEPELELKQTTQAIVDGEPAGDAYAAVGALVASRMVFDYQLRELREKTTPFCTGTLISASTVLTAKHCTETVLRALTRDYAQVYFAIGADARNPERRVAIKDALGAPGDEGGFVHYGRDVGVVFLDEEVDDIEPLKVAGLKDKHVGRDFEVVGFGVQNEAGTHGTRMKGTLKLQANEGRIFELALGDFQGFQTWLTEEVLLQPPLTRTLMPDAGLDAGMDAGSGTTSDTSDPDPWTTRYEGTLLEPGYEAFVGNDEGDPQPCSGDSGGPLLRTKNGKTKVYGVASGVLRSRKRVCDHGTVYATFGPEVLDFLKQARKDRCKGVSEEGECRGKRLVRCIMDGASRVIDKTRCDHGCEVVDGAAQCAEAQAD